MFKTFRFWLPIVASSICLFNLLGYDDKSLLLFFTSPHLMLLEDFSPILRKLFPNEKYWGVLYFINITGWFLIGVIVDFIIGLIKKR